MTANNNCLWVSDKEAARLSGLAVGTLRTWRWREMHLGEPPRLTWRRFGRAVRYYLPDITRLTAPDGQKVGA